MAGPAPIATLALEDGTVFSGRAFGAAGSRSGEIVFNTSMMGYQEILTDPSYCGQIVTLTYPLIGNYGINDVDSESERCHLHGLVVKELSRHHSSHRASCGLHEFLLQQGVTGITGIDTRALTRRVRSQGSMRAYLTTEDSDPLRCIAKAREAPKMVGANLVSTVAPRRPYVWRDDGNSLDAGAGELVVAIDCGMKRNILRSLAIVGCNVHVVPPDVAAGQVLEQQPRGVFISNGPGDPAAVEHVISLIAGLIGKVPVFGICLGHQLLSLALGAQTYKLKFGHHGGNHPVQSVATGRVEITSQNHGFATDVQSLQGVGAQISHVNLNDDTVEGFVHPDLPLLGIQYHPEACPGPHDAGYLFACFAKMMQTGSPVSLVDLASAQESFERSRTVPQSFGKPASEGEKSARKRPTQTVGP